MAWTVSKTNLATLPIAELFATPLAEICYRINQLEQFAGRGDPSDSTSPWNDANDAATAAGYSGSLPDFEPITLWRTGQSTTEQTFPIAANFSGLAININGCLNLERAQEALSEMLKGPVFLGSWVQGSYEFAHGVAHRQWQTVTDAGSPTDTQHRWDTRFTSHFVKPSDTDAAWFLDDVLTAASEGTAWKTVHGYPLRLIHQVFAQLYGALEQLTKLRYKCLMGTPNYRTIVDSVPAGIWTDADSIDNNNQEAPFTVRTWTITWKGDDNDIDVYADSAYCTDKEFSNDAWDHAVDVGDASTIDTPSTTDWDIIDITRAWTAEGTERVHASAPGSPSADQKYTVTRFGRHEVVVDNGPPIVRYSRADVSWGFKWGTTTKPRICTKFTYGTLAKVYLSLLVQCRNFDPVRADNEIEFSLDGGGTYIQAIEQYEGSVDLSGKFGKPDYEAPSNEQMNVARTIKRLDLGTTKVTIGAHTGGEDWSMESSEIVASEGVQTSLQSVPPNPGVYSVLAAFNDESVEPDQEKLPNNDDFTETWYSEDHDDATYRGRGLWVESTLSFTYGP
ncbi:MAG: hypothetical protein V3U60_16200 [Gammaproteobacteria bacterium]